jgi:sugar lactone lactonase YvrE
MSNHVGEPLCLSPMVTAAVPGLTCTLAESPVWDDRRHMLFWVDIPAGRVHGLCLAENHHCHWDMGEPVSAIGLTEGERILVAGKSGIWTLSPKTGDRTLWCAIAEFGGGMRPNDGKIGPDGAFWVGTMEDRDDRGQAGKLYRIDKDGTARVMLDGLVTPNGIEWTPDGRRMFLAETRELVVRAWDFDPATGDMSNPRDHLRFQSHQGKPDGAIMDAGGTYWVCGIYSASMWGFAPDGTLIGEIRLDHPMVTMPCLAGAGLDQLFVTSLTRKGSGEGTLLRVGPCGLIGRKANRIQLH